MELDRCRILLLVIETGNLSAAAEKLNYTTSGISRAIAALEKELGFPLFLRRHDGVSPTAECVRLLPYLREFVFAGESCLQFAAKIRHLDVGTITLGTAYSAYHVQLSQWIGAFRQQHPHISFRLKNGYSTELLQQLEGQEVDICLISRRDGDFLWLPLCQDELVAWIPGSSPLAQMDAIPLETFASHPYIDILPNADSHADSDNARLFRRHHIRPNTQFTVTDSASAYSMVSAGLGLAMNNRINSHYLLNGDVQVRPLAPRQSIEIGIATRQTCAPAVQTFLAFLQQHTGDLHFSGEGL